MKNGKASNVFPLLKCIGHPLGDNQRTFEERYCDGQMKPFGHGGRQIWLATGGSNLEELNREIGLSMQVKTKEDVLKDLPKKVSERSER